MRIIKIFIVIVVVSLFKTSCRNVSIESNLNMSIDYDTINYGEVVTAKIWLSDINDSIHPIFKILRSGDTAQIPSERTDDKICGIFKAVGRIKGNNIYDGFVEYYNKNNEFKKEEFSIEFFVKMNE